MLFNLDIDSLISMISVNVLFSNLFIKALDDSQFDSIKFKTEIF